MRVLSQIWKFGGIIERENDGSLKLSNHTNIPNAVLKAAEPIFDEIDTYLKSVEGMKGVDLTNWKIIMHMCGWIKNKKIEHMLNNNEQIRLLAYDFQAKLDGNGWKNILDDYRQFENDESTNLKKEIHARAVAFAKGAK